MGDKYKVLVAEKISAEGVEKLKEYFDVDAFDGLPRDELLARSATTTAWWSAAGPGSTQRPSARRRVSR